MTRVLLVDDEALVRAGLRMILEAAGDIDVVGEATDGDSIESPDATTRTAFTSSSGGVSLRRKPAAPACSARNT